MALPEGLGATLGLLFVSVFWAMNMGASGLAVSFSPSIGARLLDPRWAIALWMVGGVIGMIPPRPLGPLPWAALVAGGVIYGLGAVGLGVALWRGPEAGGA